MTDSISRSFNILLRAIKLNSFFNNKLDKKDLHILLIERLLKNTFSYRKVSSSDNNDAYEDKDLDTYQLDSIHLMYFAIEFALTCCEKINKPVLRRNICSFCNASPKNIRLLYEDVVIKFIIYCNELSILLNTFYAVPLNVSMSILKEIKCLTATSEGMYPFEVSYTFNNIIKHLNILDDLHQKTIPFIFYGMMYKNYSKRELEIYVEQLMHNRALNNTRFAATFYSVKTQTVPEHFCAIFLDTHEKIFFFYNPLAKKEQLFVKWYELLQTKDDESWQFITNTNRHQDENKLCGIYSIRFVTKMLDYIRYSSKLNSINVFGVPGKELIVFFKKYFDNTIDLDEKMYSFRNRYVINSNINHLFLSCCANLNRDLFNF